MLVLDEFAESVDSMMRCIWQLYESDEHNRPICQQMAVSVLMIAQKLLDRKLHNDNFHKEQKNEDLIRSITSYLDNHYTEVLTLEDISRDVHISKSYLLKLFKRETGLSPMQYVIHQRIGEAQSLLMETTLPIKEIEERLGFGSSCHLAIMFKKYVGISPREYRKHFRLRDVGN